jgi:mono/diheme cytochrome c family protein
MIRRALRWFFVAVLILGPGFWLLTRPQTLPGEELPQHQPSLANGEMVFHTGGCASCHEANLGGGLEMESPFGTFRVPNISPDAATGIGNWTELEFVNAMMRGVAPDGRHYYPAFPYASYARMTVQDIVDLKAWSDSQAAVNKLVAGHELHFPWNVRRGVGLWKKQYFRPGPPGTQESAANGPERGRYLVEGAGHCRECHTARNMWGGFREGQELAGGPNPDGDGKVPNITPHEDGLKDWSEADIAYYLESGFTPDFDTVGGSMVAVQENLAHLPDSDRAAIAAYLKTIPAIADPGK